MELINKTLLKGENYKILSKISQGNFGITYLAEQLSLDRKVCIKEFFFRGSCERANNGHVTVTTSGKEVAHSFLRKFMREAKRLSKFDHPNIVKVIDVFEENGTAYMVMDYIDGETLQHLVDNKVKLSESEALGYIQPLCDALEVVHEKGLLHLDIKPSNILIKRNSHTPVLIDFGISKFTDVSGEDHATTTPVALTKGYAPLEQYGQDLTKLTAVTDVYAVVATLYKLVTGVTPPEAAIIVTDGIKSPMQLNPAISEKLSSIILQSLSVKPNHRAQSINKLKAELMGISQPKVVHEIEEFTDILTEVNTIASKTAVPKLGLIFTEVVNDIIFKMIAIESGTFLMGSNEGNADERPVRNVTLSGFYMGQTEVNQSLWKAVMSSNPSGFKGDNLPVEQVSWDDVQIFLGKLNKITGKNYRLPTEAEWEYAAGGGEKNRTKFAGTNNESSLGNYGWYSSNSKSTTHPVGTKQPNQFGLYDMSGNVWEWCNDWYDRNYYTNSQQNNPKGPSSGSRRVYRGGGWRYEATGCRVAYRGSSTPGNRGSYLGFRLALVP